MNPRIAIVALFAIASCTGSTAPPHVTCIDCHGAGVEPPPSCEGPECTDVPGTGCELVTSTGPVGRLVDYFVAPSGGAWMLTRDPDTELTTLWEQRNGAWLAVPFDTSCRRGVLALDAQGRPHVACAVPSDMVADYDVRLFSIGAQGVTSRRVLAATQGLAGTIGGWPVALTFDATGRAAVLWQSTTNGTLLLGEAGYFLSRDAGTAWSSRYLLPYSEMGYTKNFHARLLTRGTAMYVTYKDGARNALIIARIAPSSIERTVWIYASTLGAEDFALDYTVLADPDAPNAWHVGLSDPSTFYDDLEEPGYVAYHHVVGEAAGARSFIDGAAPIGDRPAGLAGMSMVLDPGGSLVMSYDALVGDELRLAHRVGDAWAVAPLMHGHSIGDTALRFDTRGRLHVAYEDLAANTVSVLEEHCAP